MKKLIAIAVVFALAAGAAFAELSVGAYIASNSVLVSGSTDEGSDKETGGFHTGHIQATGATEDNKFGGWVRISAAEGGWWAPSAYAFVWWQPSDMFRLQIGHFPDGDFATNFIVGWGWHGSDAEDIVAQNGYTNLARAGGIFYGGVDVAGTTISITPVEGLAINIGIPFEAGASANDWNPDIIGVTEGGELVFGGEGESSEHPYASHVFGDVFKKINAQITYEIADIGIASLTYKGGTGFVKIADSWTGGAIVDPSTIYLGFLLTAMQSSGLEANIGLSYTFPVSINNGADFWFEAGQFWGSKATYKAPMGAGFGVNYNMGEFNVKARLGANFAGSLKPDGGSAASIPLEIGFDIMPSYDLGFLVFYFNAGIEYHAKPKGGESVPLGWYINPFITVAGPGWGNIFFAGIQVQSNIDGWDVPAADPKKIGWAIPIGFTFNF
jgi:hypothetical protein